MGSLLKDTPHPQVNPHAPPALFPSHRQGSVLSHLLSPPTCRPWTLPTSGSHTMWPHVSKGPPLHSVSARRSPSLRSNTPLRGQTTLHLQLHQLPGTRAGLWALRAATNKAPGNTRSRLRPSRTVTLGLPSAEVPGCRPKLLGQLDRPPATHGVSDSSTSLLTVAPVPLISNILGGVTLPVCIP